MTELLLQRIKTHSEKYKIGEIICENTLYYMKAQTINGCFCCCQFQLITSMLIPTIFLFLFSFVQMYVLARRKLEIKIIIFGSIYNNLGVQRSPYFLQSITQYHGFSDTSLFSNYCMKTMCGLIGELLKRGK